MNTMNNTKQTPAEKMQQTPVLPEKVQKIVDKLDVEITKASEERERALRAISDNVYYSLAWQVEGLFKTDYILQMLRELHNWILTYKEKRPDVDWTHEEAIKKWVDQYCERFEDEALDLRYVSRSTGQVHNLCAIWEGEIKRNLFSRRNSISMGYFPKLIKEL